MPIFINNIRRGVSQRSKSCKFKQITVIVYCLVCLSAVIVICVGFIGLWPSAAAVMMVSISKSEPMVLCQKTDCSLWDGSEFMYLVLFTSDGKMEQGIDRRIGVASALMQVHYCTERRRSWIQVAEISFFYRLEARSSAAAPLCQNDLLEVILWLLDTCL